MTLHPTKVVMKSGQVRPLRGRINHRVLIPHVYAALRHEANHVFNIVEVVIPLNQP